MAIDSLRYPTLHKLLEELLALEASERARAGLAEPEARAAARLAERDGAGEERGEEGGAGAGE